MGSGNTKGKAPERVLVVIPALNEAASIGTVIAQVRALGLDVLVVDDGSVDETAAVARHMGVRVAQLPFNLGVGGAMRTGFKFALQHGYDAVVQVDGDGQHDPAQIPRLLGALRGADVVIGNRFAGDAYHLPAHRRCAIRLLARTTSYITKTEIRDSTSGFRAHSDRAIRVYAEHYPSEYLGDTVESLVIAHKAGLNIDEVGATMRHRTAGQSSQGTLSSIRYVARVLAATFLGLTRSWALEDSPA